MVVVFTPYELDIPVTWACMPSRDQYLAAKLRAWSRDTASITACVSAFRSRPDHPYDVVHRERPFVGPPASMMLTPAQRWNFFRELAASEMEWHGLTRQSWTVKYDHARARAGQCKHRARVLSFSRKLIARGSPADMRNTLLHEITHALAGPKHGHDRTWHAIALRIGCDGKRCHNIELAPPKWIYCCSAGCWHVPRFKRSHLSATRKRTCKTCGAACIFVRA
jgi:predicted SprT family Zn-dependent metalloprotease